MKKKPDLSISQCKVIIFDLDGVVINSLPGMEIAFTEAYREVICPYSPVPFKEYNKHLGRRFSDIMSLMKLPAEMETPFRRECYKHIDKIPLFEGIRELLETLKSLDISLGVATGKEGKRARDILNHLGVLDCFDLVIGGDEVVHAKPSPEILFKHLSYFDSEEHETIFVGDSLADIQASQQAKIPFAAALWGENDFTDLVINKPDYILTRPKDLIEILKDTILCS
ncbi:MAG: HAD family hydrolase [Parachlamydiaceae bacterium]